jgi:hypothetical protein
MKTNEKIIDGVSTDPFDYALYDENGNKLKDFDCVVMKRKLQAGVYERTKDMTFSEYRAYLDKRLENDTFWQRLKHHTKQKMLEFA